MRALVVTGPRQASVQDVPEPVPGEGDLLVEVERVGICGTDVELYTGEMAYFEQGATHFPLQLGHEWTGTVVGVGPGADESWIGRRVTGDTMLGCGTCGFCQRGTHHVCPNRFEIGIRDGWPGALAERMLIPQRFTHAIPETVSVTAAALVEPGGNSLRAVLAAGDPGRLLVLGSGTIGLLAAQFAVARGFDVELAGIRPDSLELARQLGIPLARTIDEVRAAPREYDAVIDATSMQDAPNLAAQLVDPAGRVVYIGISSTPSLLDTRDIVLKDVTAVGILSASPGLAGAIEHFASGSVRPEAIVAEVVGLSDVPARLDGKRGPGAGPGPKVHVDPRLP